MYSGRDLPKEGFPHSDIRGSTIARISPRLFAACHVLHRLLAPRHPPNALQSLNSSAARTQDQHARTRTSRPLPAMPEPARPTGRQQHRVRSLLQPSFSPAQHRTQQHQTETPGEPLNSPNLLHLSKITSDHHAPGRPGSRHRLDGRRSTRHPCLLEAPNPPAASRDRVWITLDADAAPPAPEVQARTRAEHREWRAELRSTENVMSGSSAARSGEPALPHEHSLKGGDPAAGSPTATLLRLHPSR